MKTNRESELNFAILRYALECLREGDIEMLDELGFRRDDIEAIRDFTLVDITQIADLPSPLLKRNIIDRDCLWRAIEHVRSTRQQQVAIDTLLDADAPLTMMQTLCGMTSSEYANLRQMRGVSGGAGRTRAPSEGEIEKIWEIYKTRVDDIERMTAEEWIAIKHELKEVPFRIIWPLIQSWAVNSSR